MGFISSYATKSYADKGSIASGHRVPGSVGHTPVAGGVFGRSTSGDNSIKRLIEAMRSKAPGGWSDDRYEQSLRHLRGVVYICIHRLSEQLAQSEFQVFRRDPHHVEGKRPVTEKDPPEGDRQCKPYDLVKLLERPNNEDGFGEWMYRTNTQLDLTGMALTWLLPNQLGVPMEMYSIATATAIPQAANSPLYPHGYYRIQPLYPYGPFSSWPTPNSAVGAPIPAEWMMRIKYPHPYLHYDGYSPLTAMSLNIDGVDMIDRSRFNSMRRSINPSAVLNFSEMEGLTAATGLPKEEIERIHAEWENSFQGVENHGALLVGTPGGTLEQWGSRPIDMDYPNGWDQQIAFIMAAFGLTKSAACMTDGASYASLFAALKQLHLLTLTPKLSRLASRITRELGPFFGDDLIVEVRCKRIDDHDVRGAQIDKLITGKAITKGELRRAMEFPVANEEWEKDIAGDPSEAEKEAQQQQGGMPGMPGMEGGEEESAEPNIEEALNGKVPDEMRQEDEATAASRPTPDNMNKDSLGPRGKPNEPRQGKGGLALLNGHTKSLNGTAKKSLYQQVRERLRGD